ncbi:MAG: hypothetical protein NTY96_08495 [Bacteroidetes bacterium]|nr:hypothetical protein [Bacteroidota bacterium]
MKDQKKRVTPPLPIGPAKGGKPGPAMEMTDKIKALYQEHHKKFHLDENGEWKKKLKEKGFQFMKKHMK